MVIPAAAIWANNWEVICKEAGAKLVSGELILLETIFAIPSFRI